MFTDMFNAMDRGHAPRETFYDGYVVNAVIDACYKSARTKQWEPVLLDDWRGQRDTKPVAGTREEVDGMQLVKREHMPDGKVKLILRDKASGRVVQRIGEE